MMNFTPVHELAQAMGEADGYQVYEAQPDVIYPAMVGYARGVLAGEIAIYSGEQEFRTQAEQMERELFSVWDWALLPIDEVGDEYVRAVRERALELLRRWFTRRLKEYARRPIGIHITRDPRYCLNW